MTKQILKLNDHFQEMGIFFPIYETCEAEYLKRILGFLEREVQRTEPPAQEQITTRPLCT